MIKLDLTGHKYGRLTVVEDAGRDKHGCTLWRSSCDCGNEVVTVLRRLRSGKTKSCGCYSTDIRKLTRKDYTGVRFGRLVALEIDEEKSQEKGKVVWRCLCDCGNEAYVTRHNLARGCTKSCGCLYKEGNNTTHGMGGNLEYRIWSHMKSRCYNANDSRFHTHGERGISVCERWRNSFENFFEDMGFCPEDKYSIDRVDNNGNYSPENCRWASRSEQANNKRNNKILTYSGKTQNLLAWSEELGIKYGTLQRRLYCGWSIEKAFTEPVKKKLKVLRKDQ